MIKLLIDESPLIVLPSLAERIGLDEAIVLQQVHYLVGMSTKVENSHAYKGGFYWVFNSIEQWQSKYFRWWSIPTVKRIFQNLTKSCLLITETFSAGKGHRRLWYRVNHDLVATISTINACEFSTNQSDRIKMIRSKWSDQNEPIVWDQNDPIKSVCWDQNDPLSIYKNSSLLREDHEEEETHPSPIELISDTEDSNPKSIAPLITKQQSSGKPITPPEVGYSAAALQNIYTKAVNVYELIDLFLLSPEISDASPPKEMMLVFSEKQKWHGWVLPWRSNKMHREFQNCNPEIVKKLATDLARKDKATPAQKYGHAIATINQWERTKGGWVNLMALCDRPILDQPSLSETSPEVSIPQYIKDWYEAQHEYHYRTQFLKAASLDDFFAGKDNRAWHQFAKEKFPSWDWTKTNPKIEDKTPCLLQTT